VRPHIGVEAQRIPWRKAQAEAELRSGKLDGNTVHRLELNLGRTGNGKRRRYLDGVPAISAGCNRADFHVHRTRLVLLVLLHPDHDHGA
jgi:hypothetical protein